MVVVLGGLGAPHLVTYVVVGPHVQLVHGAPVLLHLGVLPETRYSRLKNQDHEICLETKNIKIIK